MVVSKISETLLQFAEPLIETLDSPPKREQLEQALTVAVTVWNGVLLDDHEAGDYVAQSRRRIETVSLPGQLALFDALVERRRALFGQDRRLVGEFKLVDDPSGEVRLRAEAYALPSDATG